jgi:hypothetical protein
MKKQYRRGKNGKKTWRKLTCQAVLFRLMGYIAREHHNMRLDGDVSVRRHLRCCPGCNSAYGMLSNLVLERNLLEEVEEAA